MIDKASNNFKNSCMYVNQNRVPTLYPATPGAAPTAVPGHANPNEWGAWTVIIGNATIDGEDGDFFDVQNVHIEGITANSIFFFELRYNSVVIGRGFMWSTGTGANANRGIEFRMSATKKVAGQDLEMRIMSDQAGESVDVNPIMWTSGDAWYI